MKRLFVILIFVLVNTSLSMAQSLRVFFIDASDFPLMRANFYVFDNDGEVISNLDISDFEILEDDEPMEIISLTCPESIESDIISLVLSFDVSSSMSTNLNSTTPLILSKSIAYPLIENLSIPPGKVAIQSCSHRAILRQDFSSSILDLFFRIDQLTASGNTNFSEQFLNPRVGIFPLASRGIGRKNAIWFSDLMSTPLSKEEIEECIQICQTNNITFYAIFFGEDALEYGLYDMAKHITESTGGFCFSGIDDRKQIKELVDHLSSFVKGIEPCTIEWLSGKHCDDKPVNIQIKVPELGLYYKTDYSFPNQYKARLDIYPQTLSFDAAEIGQETCRKVSVTAYNADFKVTGFTSSDPLFRIAPPSFRVNKGETKQIDICFFPQDSSYVSSDIELLNDMCYTSFHVTGKYPGYTPKISTIKLTHPNGMERFVIGMDTVITWDGISSDEETVIQYSTNNGLNWITIAENVNGQSFKWKVPNTPSKECLARVITQTSYKFCDNDDIQVGDNLWMGCNLAVTTYCDGTPILYCATNKEWEHANANGIGAYCYYANDQTNGLNYGYLYNWFAVNSGHGLAPDGWRIASDEDWKQLEYAMGMPADELDLIGWRGDNQGYKLKSTGNYWIGTNSFSTDEIGFTALPAGLRHKYGDFFYLREVTYFWTASTLEELPDQPVCRSISYDTGQIKRATTIQEMGYSVRCVKK